MPLGTAREILATVRAATQRYPIVQNLYIVSFCLIYLMPNIWAARTLFFYITIPLGLLGLNLAVLRSTVRHPIFVITAGYFAILILTSLAAPGVHFRAIGDNLLQSLRVLLLFVVTADLVQRDDGFLKTFGVFLSAAAAVALVVNAVAFYGGPLYSGPSIFAVRLQGTPGISVYYNPNVVGVIFAVACVAGAAWLPSGRLNRIEIAWVLVATAMLYGGVVLTQSRSSIMAATAGLVVIAVLALRPRHLLWLAVAAAAALAAILLWTPIFQELTQRGASMRPMLWSHYWNLANERLWTGHGLSYDMTMYLPHETLYNAHNIMLSALVRGGILAALTLLALVVTCLAQSWMAWRRTGVLMPLALMVSATVATTVDHEMIATTLGWPWLLFWMPVAMCLGVGVRAQPRYAQAKMSTHEREPARS